MVETTSQFPEKIDELHYHSDVNITQKEVYDQYEQYIQAGNYAEAYKVIDTSNLFGWFADYFNMIENRIYSTQSFVKTQGMDKHPDQNLYTEEEPTQFKDQNKTRELKDGDVWISTL